MKSRLTPSWHSNGSPASRTTTTAPAPNYRQVRGAVQPSLSPIYTSADARVAAATPTSRSPTRSRIAHARPPARLCPGHPKTTGAPKPQVSDPGEGSNPVGRVGLEPTTNGLKVLVRTWWAAASGGPVIRNPQVRRQQVADWSGRRCRVLAHPLTHRSRSGALLTGAFARSCTASTPRVGTFRPLSHAYSRQLLSKPIPARQEGTAAAQKASSLLAHRTPDETATRRTIQHRRRNRFRDRAIRAAAASRRRFCPSSVAHWPSVRARSRAMNAAWSGSCALTDGATFKFTSPCMAPACTTCPATSPPNSLRT
jgi:hypothetical protein